MCSSNTNCALPFFFFSHSKLKFEMKNKLTDKYGVSQNLKQLKQCRKGY